MTDTITIDNVEHSETYDEVPRAIYPNKKYYDPKDGIKYKAKLIIIKVKEEKKK